MPSVPASPRSSSWRAKRPVKIEMSCSGVGPPKSTPTLTGVLAATSWASRVVVGQVVEIQHAVARNERRAHPRHGFVARVESPYRALVAERERHGVGPIHDHEFGAVERD